MKSQDVRDAARYKAYPKYKESGTDWLKEIPAHWEAKRLRYLVEVNPSASEARALAPDTEVSFIPMEAVMEFGGLDLSNERPLETIGAGYTYFRNHDIVVAKITPCFENGKCALALDLTNGIAFGTTELHVLRAKSSLDKKFLFYTILSDAFRRLGEAEMYGAGGQKRVPQSFLENFRQPYPPLEEQRVIAAFLDRKTARIDTLVAKKEQLIERLRERRSALITQAVTKGLDPAAQMKDSGVEWLGEVPRHWEVKRLKQTFISCQNGIWGNDPDGINDLPCVRVADFDRNNLRTDDEIPTLRAIEPRVAHTRTLNNGDLLVEKSGGGENQPVGTVVLYDLGIPGVCSNFVARMVVAHGFHSRFLVYVHSAMYAARVNVRWIKQNTGIQNLDSDGYFSERAAFPSYDEQAAVAEFIDGVSGKFGLLISKVQSGIDTLKEYRSSLISSAVTGKIDIRGLV